MQIGTKSKESRDTLSDQEKIVKEQLESWINDAQKAELEQRLQKAFEKNKTHAQFFSEL